MKKIVILGGESTGKSTLCLALADRFQGVMVPEFAREYLNKHGLNYVESDLLAIARGQIVLEDKLSEQRKAYLFCDTELNVIKVWSESKFGQCHSYILNEIAKREYDAYILTTPDFPWQDDPMREHPDEVMRTYFFYQYLDIVLNNFVPFCVVNGSEDNRLKQACSFIKKLFQ